MTINALFYNLRTREIEDQTGKGLSDLGLSPPNPKRIRTPLEPFQTFRDDPLRIVRAVRFAARFGRDFELDDELVRAIEREEIRVSAFPPEVYPQNSVELTRSGRQNVSSKRCWIRKRSVGNESVPNSTRCSWERIPSSHSN